MVGGSRFGYPFVVFVVVRFGASEWSGVAFSRDPLLYGGSPFRRVRMFVGSLFRLPPCFLYIISVYLRPTKRTYMELLLERDERTETYTAGRMYADGKHVCDTIEDTDRDLNRNGVFDGGEEKVYAKTAIPNGRYKITLEHSPRFSPRYDGRRVPHLNGVPHFTNVLIHTGNTADDSAGCIIVGVRSRAGVVQYSKATFLDTLMPLLFDAEKRGEEIYITIL